MVEVEDIGGYCPHCGTHHRVIESLPKRALRMSEIKSLEESEGVEVCIAVMGMSPDMAGMTGDEDVTEDMVFTTETMTRLLSLYRDHGWVVEVETEHEEDESPEEVAMEVYQEAASTVTAAMKEVSGQ